MAFHYNPKIVTDGLTFCLDGANIKSYPGSGTTAFDLTTNGNDTPISNGPTFNNGYWTFDGTTQYMSVPNEDGITNFTENDNYTVSFWFNPASTQNYTVNNDNDVVEKWDGGSQYPFVFRYYRSSENIQAAVFVSGVGSNSTTISISSDTWWNITGVFNWSSSQLKLYTNGGYHNTNTATLNLTGITNDHPISIMRRGNNSNYTTGSFASLMVYNRALSDTEVKQNFNAIKGRFGL